MGSGLSAAEVEGFVERGFVRIDDAFSRATAEAACRVLWQDAGCDPDQPATWTRPVIRLGFYREPPFAEAARSPRLCAAFDRLVGAGRWLPRADLGTFALRFPSAAPPDDAGWHVDASFPGDDPSDYRSYRVNLRSRGRALLMLFLFTDVGDDDAPTRLRVGSHREVARVLAPAGEAGLAFFDLAARLAPTERAPIEHATGPAGTVYLCHPFLVHAAQAHRGRTPRVLAQPPLHLRAPLDLDVDDAPVARAIRAALG